MVDSAYHDEEWHSAIYVMVDDICVQNGAFPPGTMGALTRVIDTVLTTASLKEARPCAEDMLIAMHRLRSSLKQNSSAPGALRSELRHLCNQWMEMARFC